MVIKIEVQNYCTNETGLTLESVDRLANPILLVAMRNMAMKSARMVLFKNR